MSHSPLPKLIAQALNVLAPVQVGICQKTPRIPPGQWVKISQIIRMGCGRRSNMPNHQCIAGGALVIWHVAASATADPDYLGYFNPLAGRDPGRLLADSDLDWGQDVQRLSDELRQRGVRHVLVDLHGKADLEKHGFPDFAFLEPHKPAAGWIAISITSLDFGSGAPPYDGYVWLLKFQPITTVGKSIKLYHIDSPPPFSRAGEGMK